MLLFKQTLLLPDHVLLYVFKAMTLCLISKQQKSILWRWLALFFTPLVSYPQRVLCCCVSHNPLSPFQLTEVIYIYAYWIPVRIAVTYQSKFDNAPYPSLTIPYTTYTWGELPGSTSKPACNRDLFSKAWNTPYRGPMRQLWTEFFPF